MDMNVRLKIPAVERLLKMTTSGIGAVAAPILARWRARAQADALRIEAAGKADAMSLIASAQAEAADKLAMIPSSAQTDLEIRREIEARLTFQEEKRQHNIESVVRGAAGELGEKKVDDNDIDHDWTATFFSSVQDVSSEKMQDIWAKILAGEVESPGATSMHTLSILKSMSQKDAELFQRVSSFVIHNFILREKRFTESIEQFPTYDDIVDLASHNLAHTGSGLTSILRGHGAIFFDEAGMYFRIYDDKKPTGELEIRFPSYILSKSGIELCRTIRDDLSEQYLRAVAKFINDKSGATLARGLRRPLGEGRAVVDQWVDL